MIKTKLLPIITVCSILFLTACSTVAASPKEEKKPDDPPNVKFVKELQKYLDDNNIEAAIAHFDNIPSKLKDDIELKNLLGALLYSDTQYDKAISVANEILEIDSSNIDALELISMCNHAKGDKTAYKETSERILAVDPFNTSVNIQKAEDYALNKKWKLARESYKKALKGDSKNDDALFGYAQMSYYCDDVKTAEDIFQQILDKDPDNTQALSYLGKIAYEEENYLRATNLLNRQLNFLQIIMIIGWITELTYVIRENLMMQQMHG